MKILFLARHFSYLRLFESAIRELAKRGHTIHLSADREESMGGRGMVERIAADFPGVTVGWTPGREAGTWSELARKLRLGLDYLRARSRERAPMAVVVLAALPGLRTTWGRRLLAAFLRGLERSIPRSPEIDAFLRDQNPDLLLITPLIDLGSPQADHFASARAAGR